jgi:signal transduction histidine kinase
VPERLFLELVAYGIRSAGITVTLNLGENLRTFGADPDQFGRVVTNLLLNAQQALRKTPQPRRLYPARGTNRRNRRSV